MRRFLLIVIVICTALLGVAPVVGSVRADESDMCLAPLTKEEKIIKVFPDGSYWTIREKDNEIGTARVSCPHSFVVVIQNLRHNYVDYHGKNRFYCYAYQDIDRAKCTSCGAIITVYQPWTSFPHSFVTSEDKLTEQCHNCGYTRSVH